MKFRLRGFSIVREIGEGTFGNVYEGIGHRNGTRVAIKVLKKCAGSDAAERFNREATILRREADNAHVVDLVAADLDSDFPYIVMEYCAHGSLEEWTNVRRPWTKVVAVLSHVVRGLSGIHGNGGFHRDIKPANILLAADPNHPHQMIAKVADLGLARLPRRGILTTAQPAGTNGYMAPEILGGERYHRPADIYSLGITGVQLLTGKLDVDGLQDICCPRQLKTLLRRMTSTSARERPTLGEVDARLRRVLRPDAQTPKREQQVNLSDLAPWLLGGAAVVGLLALAASER